MAEYCTTKKCLTQAIAIAEAELEGPQETCASNPEGGFTVACDPIPLDLLSFSPSTVITLPARYSSLQSDDRPLPFFLHTAKELLLCSEMFSIVGNYLTHGQCCPTGHYMMRGCSLKAESKKRPCTTCTCSSAMQAKRVTAVRQKAAMSGCSPPEWAVGAKCHALLTAFFCNLTNCMHHAGGKACHSDPAESCHAWLGASRLGCWCQVPGQGRS